MNWKAKPKTMPEAKIPAPRGGKNPLLPLLRESYRTYTLLAEGMLEMTYDKTGKTNLMENKEKDPSEIFKGATFNGKLVPQEHFVRMLIIKPIYEDALMQQYRAVLLKESREVRVTDGKLDFGGAVDAKAVLFNLCLHWRKTYSDHNRMCVRNGMKAVMPSLTEERVTEILSFFKFDGSRVSIAAPHEMPAARKAAEEFMMGKHAHFNGKGTKADVKAAQKTEKNTA